jgi:hypothetical protein
MSGLQENLKSIYAHDATVLAGIENGNIRGIPLTQGKIAIVDVEDYEWLSRWKWRIHEGRNYPYASRIIRIGKGEQKHIKMHREILGLTNPQIWVDHINHNGLDNRKNNLRIASKRLNAINTSMRLDNTSGYRGVSKNSKVNKWQAQIFHNKRVLHCGYYTNIEDAARAYDVAALRFRGNDAILNFSENKEKYDVFGNIQGETGTHYRAHRGKRVLGSTLAVQTWS